MNPRSPHDLCRPEDVLEVDGDADGSAGVDVTDTLRSWVATKPRVIRMAKLVCWWKLEG